jgi:TonB family protein
MSLARWLGLVGSALLAVAFGATADADSAPKFPPCSVSPPPAPGFQEAVAIHQPSPTYPGAGLLNWSEGWALTEFRVAADGTVHDVAIVDALGPAPFATSAVQTVARWRFTPAKRNGVAVEQPWRQASFLYKFFDSKREATHVAFLTSYNRARKQIADNRHDDAIATLEDAFKDRLSLYEQAMGSFALAVAYAKRNDRELALYHIRHATIDAGEYLDKRTRAEAVEAEAELQALNGNFVDALCTYEVLPSVPGYAPTANAAETRNLMDRVKELMADPKPLVFEGRLIERPFAAGSAVWRHPLMRRKFSFADVKGEAKTFQLACLAAAHQSAVNTEQVWTVPADAGPCILRVEGAAGATFKFIEEN